MELYVLDSLLRRTQVVDQFESLIWTDRYADCGDFELDIVSTNATRAMFQVGTHLAVNNSYSVMTVETSEDTESTDGKDILKVKGFSIEDVLKDRVAKNTMSSTTFEPTWNFTDTPGNIARAMFDHICRTGSLNTNDIIPFLQPGSIFSAGTNPESTTPITWSQAPAVLFDAIKELCDPYDLGFRLYRNFDNSQLYFEIYTGDDRTTRQTTLPAVIFGPAFDNIQNTTELINIQGSKNVAYVFSPAGYKVVYGEHVDSSIVGFDRRVLVVNADVALADPASDTLMTEAGTQALNNVRATEMFDGEINQYSTYVYGVDYTLGDIVEVRNRDGVTTYKRITENILISDSNGDRSYPTLAAGVFLGVNTWASLTNKSTVWNDYDADTTTTWSTL